MTPLLGQAILAPSMGSVIINSLPCYSFVSRRPERVPVCVFQEREGTRTPIDPPLFSQGNNCVLPIPLRPARFVSFRHVLAEEFMAGNVTGIYHAREASLMERAAGSAVTALAVHSRRLVPEDEWHLCFSQRLGTILNPP